MCSITPIVEEIESISVLQILNNHKKMCLVHKSIMKVILKLIPFLFSASTSKKIFAWEVLQLLSHGHGLTDYLKTIKIYVSTNIERPQIIFARNNHFFMVF